MNANVYQLLWKMSPEPTGEYVFTFAGMQICADLVTKKFRHCARKAGLNRRVHFHSLRHTFATWLVQGNVSIYEVQKLLGHSSISVTQVYSHLAASELQEAVKKLEITTN